MMSGHGTVETAVEATRLGAYDFIEKPLSIAKLLLTVRRALEADAARRERRTAPRGAARGRADGAQRGDADTARAGRRIAQHDTPVLISGESGTGKEVCARYLHAQSSRAAGPFVRVAVAGIMSSDSTVELFGGEDGEPCTSGRWSGQTAGRCS